MYTSYNYPSVLQVLTFLLMTIRYVYWFLSEKNANKEKPKQHATTTQELTKRIITLILGAFISLQLLGVSVLPFQNNIYVQYSGLLLVFVSICISITARISLGSNWAHAAEYQIKKGHTLTTDGIYKYIRHPIYTGMFLSCIGAELVTGSYILVAFIFILPATAYFQAKMEERILLKEFGKGYASYMKSTKMFIPFVW